MNAFMSSLVTVLGGALFGFGLALSGMVSPEVVLSFLLGQDLGLMLVMGGAVMVTLVVYQLAPRKLAQPVLGGSFSKREALMDRDTLVGAVIFGMGWGMSGVCPGPAIAGLGVGNTEVLWALVGVCAGAYLQGWWASHHSHSERG
jgi:uncharacterized membrane protein YedE/YeeE